MQTSSAWCVRQYYYKLYQIILNFQLFNSARCWWSGHSMDSLSCGPMMISSVSPSFFVPKHSIWLPLVHRGHSQLGHFHFHPTWAGRRRRIPGPTPESVSNHWALASSAASVAAFPGSLKAVLGSPPFASTPAPCLRESGILFSFAWPMPSSYCSNFLFVTEMEIKNKLVNLYWAFYGILTLTLVLALKIFAISGSISMTKSFSSVLN